MASAGSAAPTIATPAHPSHAAQTASAPALMAAEQKAIALYWVFVAAMAVLVVAAQVSPWQAERAVVETPESPFRSPAR